MFDMNAAVGSHDVLFITLDTLRYDAAQNAFRSGRTPNLASFLPRTGWERRHSPGSFTYEAHHAFFAGFLPTPVAPGKHPRPFAVRFPGSETIAPETCVFDAPDIVTGLAEPRRAHTLCIGGVGFFNKLSPLGRVLPGLFRESHWSPELGVTDPKSTANQVDLAVGCIARLPTESRLFLFLNVSAIHQPNRCYLPGAEEDSLASHEAALAYVDGQLPRLFLALQRRAPVFCVVCSDHGTAYGDDVFWGLRLAHPVVWTVPYAEFTLPWSDT